MCFWLFGIRLLVVRVVSVREIYKGDEGYGLVGFFIKSNIKDKLFIVFRN